MWETLKNAWRTAELRKKLLYVALLLFVFRVGAVFVPVVGVDSAYIAEQVETYSALGFLNMVSGGYFHFW